MKRRTGWLILLVIGLLLSACQQGEDNLEEPENKVNNENNIENGVPNEKQENVPELLSDLKVREIVITTIEAMDEQIAELQVENPYWYDEIDEDIFDEEADDDRIRDIIRVTKEKLGLLATGTELDELARRYLYLYFAIYEGSVLTTPGGTHTARFEVIEQSADYFKASYLRLADEAGYDVTGTISVEFKKENDQWLYVSDSFIDVEDKPFELTFADLEDYYDLKTGEMKQTEYIDHVEKDGEAYIVIKVGDYYEARKVKDSQLDFSIANEYQTN